jgi:hypothetical protein
MWRDKHDDKDFVITLSQMFFNDDIGIYYDKNDSSYIDKDFLVV